MGLYAGTLGIFDNQLLMVYFDGNSHKPSFLTIAVENRCYSSDDILSTILENNSHIYE
jgi:hypothetical protein